MKRFVAIILMILTLSATAACSGDADKTDKTELNIYAAASLTETLTQIAEDYRSVVPDVELIYNFDSSGTLKTQITEGAVCDLFISAAQKQMDELADGGYILADTRTDLLENEVVLCVPEDDRKNIRSFDEMAQALQDGEILMAMGNEDVPVGQYTQKILAYYHLDESQLAAGGKLSYGVNVKEVAAQIAEGAADCGVVYRTDATSEGLKAVDTATEEMCGQVIYPAAVLRDSRHIEAATDFLQYLQSDEAAAVFRSAGFTPIK